MSRIGKAPITVPGGVDVEISGTVGHGQGPQGRAVPELPELVTVQPGRRHAPGRPRRRHPRGPRDARSDAVAGREHGHRRDRRASARSSTSSASATAPRRRAPTASSWRSASRTRSSSTPPRASSSSSPSPPASRCTGSTSSWSARWPRTSVPGASRSRTRARACATSTSTSAARPARPASEAIAVSDKSKKKQVGAHAPSCPGAQERDRHRRASPPGRVPLEPARRGTGHRRPGRRDARRGQHARDRPPHAAPPRTARLRPRSASWSPSGPRPPGSSTVVFDRGGFRYHGRVAALATPPEKQDWSSDGTEQGQLGPAAA